MRILVTGGCGFIASHLVNHLVRTYPDYFVLNLDALEPCSSLANVEVGGAPNYAFVKGDLRSTDLLRHLMVQHRIDTVVHAAAHTHVDNSFGNSIAFTENNVLGTHALLEVARSCGVGRFIHVSTDEVYGSCGDERKDEGSVLAPTNPYSASKAAAEHVVRSYHISYGLPVIVVRGNNVYGPRQYPEKLIPKTIMRVARGLRPCLHGDGSNRRHYLHVDDVVAAYDVLLHRGAVGETYNIGSPTELTNEEVARRVWAAMRGDGGAPFEAEHVEDRKFNDVRYHLTSDRLHALGWRPRVDFDEGLAATIAWYRAHAEGHWASLERALRPHPE